MTTAMMKLARDVEFWEQYCEALAISLFTGAEPMTPEQWDQFCDVLDIMFPVEDSRFETVVQIVAAVGRAYLPQDADSLERYDSLYAERRSQLRELEALERLSRRDARAAGLAFLGGDPPCIPSGKNWLCDPNARANYRRLIETRYPNGLHHTRTSDPTAATAGQQSSARAAS